MHKKLLETDSDYLGTILRVGLGLVILPHGAQKLLGWFGGPGLGGTVDFFSQALGVPAVLTLLVIAAEFFGALGLIVGLFSRVAAAGIALVMLGAVAFVHLPNGYFMNWSGTQGGEGFEYHILAVAIAVAVMIKGSGAFSLDRQLARAEA
jgi:putative oxidoreductase